MKSTEAPPGQQLEKMHTVLEIGTSPGNEYHSKYKKPLAPSQHYELVNINYDNFPGEPEKGEELLPYEDNSIDEIVISNVFSDLGYQPIGEDQTSERIKNFWKYWSDTHPAYYEVEDILNEVSYFQKTRTITEIIRVLRHGGKLTIYENYNNLTPEAYKRLIEDMRKNKDIDFREDKVEEQRIQPIFDKPNKDFLESAPESRIGLTMPFPRNEVYTIIKK